MGALSRPKGKRGELELAGVLADLTGWQVRRRVRQHAGDADLEGIPGWDLMTPQSLLDRLAAAGLTVTASDDRLRVQPAEKLTADLRAAVVAMKAELLATLGGFLSGPKGTPKVAPRPAKVDGRARKNGSAVGAPAASPPEPTRSHERKLQRQRKRRAASPRIDYYPSPEAAKALNELRRQSAGGNASNIIDRVLIKAGAEIPELRP